MLKDLENLISQIRERKKNPKISSYTNKLFNDKKLSIKKVKEEIGVLRNCLYERQARFLA